MPDTFLTVSNLGRGDMLFIGGSTSKGVYLPLLQHDVINKTNARVRIKLEPDIQVVRINVTNLPNDENFSREMVIESGCHELRCHVQRDGYSNDLHPEIAKLAAMLDV